MVRVQKQEDEEKDFDSPKDSTLCGGTVRTSLGVLQSASDFQIQGGNISSIGGDSTSFTARGDVHVTINHNHPPSSTPSLSVSNTNSSMNSIGASYIGRDRYLEATEQSTSTIRRNCDIYRSYLSTKGRGLPLWIPEPNQNLPIQYQRKGISVGDVGVPTASGGFTFLFNIFLSKNNPINPRVMPDGFKPFNPKRASVSRQRDLKDNSYLAGPSNISARRDRGNTTLIFESAGYDGAILAMPVGAKSEDLPCLVHLRKYVTTNLTNWYRYVRIHLGMDIQNGDLKVVTGCDKTSAWGMACLGSGDDIGRASPSSSHSSLGLSSGEDRRFSLEFGPTLESDGRTRGGRYEWAYSGEVAEARAGPDASEVAQLRRLGGQGEVENLEDDVEHYDNQCLFLRTMNPMLPEKTWEDILLEEEEDDEDDEAEDEEDEDEERDETSTYRRDGQPSYSFPKNTNQKGGPSALGRQNNCSGVRCVESEFLSRDSVSDSGFSNMMTGMVALDASDMPSAFPSRLMSFEDHPSVAINKFLLQHCSEKAVMAMSLDQDWISVLREDDETLPSSEELLKRILETYPIRHDLEEGTVFFDSKQYHNENDIECEIATSKNFPSFRRPLSDRHSLDALFSAANQRVQNLDEISTLAGYDLPTRPTRQRKMKKALLIGIEGSERSGALQSHFQRPEAPEAQPPNVQAQERRFSRRLNDVAAMRRMLEDLGYDPEDIVVLTDHNEVEVLRPTRANILSEMKKFVQDARAGDQFFFCFSGQGGHAGVNDLKEEDGKDEFIVASDGQSIMDDELRTILVDPLPPGCSLVGVFDSCHSGTLLDLPHYRCNRANLPWMSQRAKDHDLYGQLESLPEEKISTSENRNRRPSTKNKPKADVIFLSSSDDGPIDSLGSYIADRLLGILRSNVKYRLDKIVSHLSAAWMEHHNPLPTHLSGSFSK